MTEQKTVSVYCVEKRESYALVKPGTKDELVKPGDCVELDEGLANHLVARGDFSLEPPTTCVNCGSLAGVESRRCFFCGEDPHKKTSPSTESEET